MTDDVIAVERLGNFMHGFASTAKLQSRAGESSSFIEFVCISANIIDGLLRMGLILKNQLEHGSNDLIVELLYQADEDSIISERQIYKRALEARIINNELFNKLEGLYKQRNRCVHRYIISEITYEEVLRIGLEYEEIQAVVSDEVKKLEIEQIEKSVGMTKEGSEGDTSIQEDINKMAQMKLGKLKLD